MKLPVVSRLAFDMAEVQRDHWQAKYEALLADHLAYLRPTATTTTAAVPKGALPQRPKDTLMALAAERGGRDAGLRRHLMAYVEKARANEIDDETIANKLTHWDDPEDEE